MKYPRCPSVSELRALADHADRRLALYRRRMYVGRGDPLRLAELERVAQGARDRLARARDAQQPGTPTRLESP